MNIGRITVPVPSASGLTFPLTSDYKFGTTQQYNTITHRFGELATLATQSFACGFGPRKFTFRRNTITRTQRDALIAFYKATKGSFHSFTYNAPSGKTTTPVQVIFETAPLSIDELVNACSTGITFVECPESAPTYEIAETCLRFPSETLLPALADQVQVLIPLVHIRVREGAVPDIYISDRLVTVGENTYVPKLLGVGDNGASDVIMSQSITGAADNVQFTFGNADRVMTQLANDTDLKYASIDFCLYHVQTGSLLQLWKGFVQNFVVDGSPQFTIQCSDGLFQVMRQYPTRTISRTCWKTFNDGLNCPYATEGEGGDPDTCDYTFDGDNGCKSHGMHDYFGGVPVEPQGVQAKDNSTGTWGFGRNSITSTSVVSDTIWGKVLAEIWCNDDGDPGNAFIANAMVADFRNEGDFAAGLGIVGAGPISEYTGMSVQANEDGYRFIVAPEMDGQPPHGFKVDSDLRITDSSGLGIREIAGTDPTNDRIAISPWPATFLNTAAGTAFVEIRISTPKQPILPTAAEQHNITVPISKGLAGWVWDSDGVRTLVQGLTNPFWIAVNCYLRALGLFNAESATQLEYFDLESLVQPDNFSGAADIANLTVDTLVGGGSETQFVFNGVLGEQKPFRDWLTEILNCALGYFYFSFGKLTLGIRENSGTVSAFTVGNMLFQTLRLEPINAAFEKLTIDYAEKAIQYEANIADYEDKDHSQYYGRSGAPLATKIHSVGLSGISQALRVAATRTREEVGGVNPAEWAAARVVSFKTTVLALDTEVGQIASMTHPDMPGGSGEFRITGWKLYKDWSIQIEGKTTTDSMYDLTVGPKPADVLPAGLPILFYPQPQGEWQAYQIKAHEDDALFPGEYTFDLAQDLIPGSNGTLYPQAIASGKLPVNKFIRNCPAPSITAGQVTEDNEGGYLKGGLTLKVSVCATDNLKRCSPPSEIIIVKTDPESDTNSFTINGIDWPDVEGLTGYVIFAHYNNNFICMQQAGNGLPTAIQVLGPLANTHWAMPNPKIKSVRLKAKLVLGPGAVGEIVTSVAGTEVTVKPLIDPLEIDDWTGRYLMVVSRPDGSSPYGTWKIIEWDVTTGKFTLDRSATVPGHPEQSIQATDGIVVCYQGYDNSEDPTRIEDEPGTSSWQNYPTYRPHTGLVPSSYKGDILRVIAGTGKGLTSKIIDNDKTGWTLDQPITIDETSVWIIEESTWTYTADSSPIDNSDPLLQNEIILPVPNFAAQGLVVGAVTVTDKAVESDFGDMPVRLLYIYATDGTRAPYPWQANAAQPNVTSYLDRTDWTFDVQTSVQTSGTSISTNLTITGNPPQNVYSGTQLSGVDGFTMQVGGTIKGGQDVFLSLCATDAGQGESKPSEQVFVNVPFGTDTNTVGLDPAEVQWPDGATGWDLFTGPDSHNLTHQKSGTGAPTKADLTLTELNVATYGRPDDQFDHFATSVKRVVAGAIIVSRVTFVTEATIILEDKDIFSDYSGLRLFVVAKGDLSKKISVFDSTIFYNVNNRFTLSEDVSTIIEEGDIVGVYLFADIVSSNTIGCSRFTLPEATPMPTENGGLAGNLVRIWGGAGAGQTAVIASNTADTITIEGEWATLPDIFSYFVIEEPSWSFSSESSPYTSPNPFGAASLSVSVTSLQWDALLVMVQTANAGGTYSEEVYSPKRIVWVNRDPFLGAESCQFTFGQDSSGGWADIAVGNITNSPEAKVGGKLIGWSINAGEIPTGADIQIDIVRIPEGSNTATSIFGPLGPFVVLPDGDFEAKGFDFKGIQTINPGDKLRGMVVQTGSDHPGKSCTVQLYWL